MRISLGLTLCALAAQVQAQATERLFYYVDREDSYTSLVKHIDQISIVAPQVYVVDSLGIMWGQLDKRVVDLAKKHNVKVMPLFTNEGFQQPGLHRLLGDSLAQKRSIASMVDLCRSHGYWGLQFDVENINITDRDRFTKWYTDAGNALHAVNCRISIAVVHRTEEGAGPTAYGRFMQDSWRGGYDFAAIGKASDFVTLMTYSQHTRRTVPGPIAGMTWVKDALDYALQFIPPEKLSLGIPTYGGRWYTRAEATTDRASSTNESVSWTWGSGFADRYGAPIRWDSTEMVPYAYYSVGGVNEWLFLEDVRSFKAKLDLAKSRKVRGFSVWVLGPEDPRIWDLLAKEPR